MLNTRECVLMESPQLSQSQLDIGLKNLKMCLKVEMYWKQWGSEKDYWECPGWGSVDEKRVHSNAINYDKKFKVSCNAKP